MENDRQARPSRHGSVTFGRGAEKVNNYEMCACVQSLKADTIGLPPATLLMCTICIVDGRAFLCRAHATSQLRAATAQ
jgi:hypothetical protein